MRAVVFSALLAAACVSPNSGPTNTAASTPSGGGTSEAAAPAAAGATTAPKNTGPKKIVGYFTNWVEKRKGCEYKVSDVNADLLTNINFAFARVDAGPGGKANPKFGIAA